jgi:hypothetical protein
MSNLTHETLMSLMNETLPEIEPTVQRAPNRRGDDRDVDRRDDERSSVENFIDTLEERGLLASPVLETPSESPLRLKSDEELLKLMSDEELVSLIARNDQAIYTRTSEDAYAAKARVLLASRSASTEVGTQ